MKKKHIIWISVLTIVLIFIVILIIRLVYNSPKNIKDSTGNTKPTWSVDNINDANEKGNISEKIQIDRNPESITVLVNKENSIDEKYKPTDLVEPNIEFSFDYKDEKRKLRKEAATNLELLFQGAKYHGHELQGVSGFRSYERQETIYNYNLLKNGFDYTQIYSAMPGTSEHQTGLAIDITCPSLKGILSDSFGETKEGKWVAKNCYKYGFIIRYPKNKSNITGYGYEPWHIRYVGKDLAEYLYEKDLTLDEYYKYKMDLNLVNRKTYAYYDYLLTMKKGGYTDVSDTVLDDVLDTDNIDVSNSEPIFDETEQEGDEDNLIKPDDLFENFFTKDPTNKPIVTKEPEEDETIDIEETIVPEIEETLEPEIEETLGMDNFPKGERNRR